MWWGLDIPQAGICDIGNETLDYKTKISIRMSNKDKAKEHDLEFCYVGEGVVCNTFRSKGTIVR